MFKKTGSDTESLEAVPSYMPEGEAATNTPRPAARAVIGPSIVVKGELSGNEDVLIHGRVEGKVELREHSLTVGKEGFAKANVWAKSVFIEGEVEGDLHAEDRVVIRQSGNIRGNIFSPRVSLEDGARFKGSIDMDPETDALGASKGRNVRAVPQSQGTTPGESGMKPTPGDSSSSGGTPAAKAG